MSSYALTPYDATLSQLMFLTLGTTLTSGAANAINMGREHIYDGLMTRTRARPVVRKLITPNDAFAFAGVSGTLGVAALYFGVNPTVALLGGANIALYSGLYTTLKRRSITNTWVGAVVGAVPPLMGWAASSSLSDPGAWFLAGLLYAWQFPHFNALSYSIRDEYRRAGYVMTAWTSPALNARVALRYSIAMFPLCIGLSYFGVTDWVFALDSSIVNGWLTYQAYKFWLEHRNSPNVARHNGQLLDPNYKFSSSSSGSAGSGGASNGFARKLFWGSVIHLPAVLVLAMMHKKGQWDWLFGPDEEEAF
jgi:protoheme IX farnesyltransferase